MISTTLAGLRAPARQSILQLRLRASLCRSPSLTNVRQYAAAKPQKLQPKKVLPQSNLRRARDQKSTEQTTPSSRSSKLSQEPSRRAGVSPSQRYQIPQSLLIYYAGTFKTTFIGMQKVVAIFIFGYVCMAVVPGIWYYPEAMIGKGAYSWAVKSAYTAGALLIGLVPLLIQIYATAPFVNSIFLRIPATHQRSLETAKAYARAIPADALLSIKTLRLLPLQQHTTTARFSDLRRITDRKLGLGYANLLRLDSSRSRYLDLDDAVLRANPGLAAGKSGMAALRKKVVGQESGRTVIRSDYLDGEKKTLGPFRTLVKMFQEPKRRFYVDEKRGEMRSRAPGVLGLIWKQIPASGPKD